MKKAFQQENVPKAKSGYWRRRYYEQELYCPRCYCNDQEKVYSVRTGYAECENCGFHFDIDLEFGYRKNKKENK